MKTVLVYVEDGRCYHADKAVGITIMDVSGRHIEDHIDLRDYLPSPRVLTLEEIQSAEAVWNEWTSVDGYVECMMFNREADDDYVFVDKSGGEIYFEKSCYNDSWRCWNCRPTREQAKAVSWDRT